MIDKKMTAKIKYWLADWQTDNSPLTYIEQLENENEEKKKVIQDVLTWLNGPYGRTIDTDYSNVIRQRLAELSK